MPLNAGTGLGLSLVEAVARLHDGSLQLSDNSPPCLTSVKALRDARFVGICYSRPTIGYDASKTQLARDG